MSSNEEKTHVGAFVPTPAVMNFLAPALHQQRLKEKQQQQQIQQQQQQPVLQQRHTYPSLTLVGPQTPQPPAAAEYSSPRGHNKYDKRKQRCKMHKVTAWLALGLAFFALIMMAILYFNWRGGPLTALRQEIEPSAAVQRQEIGPPSVVTVQPKRGIVQFTLKGLPGQYSRWPEGNGIIEGLDITMLSETRLCCRIGNRYFMCDYGQGASSDLGVECFVEYTASDGGSHLLFNVQSDHMNGAQCFFHWTEKQ